MLGWLMDVIANGIAVSMVSMIVSYDSGLLHLNLDSIKEYVNARVDSLLIGG